MREDDERVSLLEVPSLADVSYLNDARRDQEPSTQSRDTSWTPLNLASLEDKPPQPPDLGGLTLAYQGKRHVFSGPQESAKTLAAYVIGLSVVRTGGTVVLIDLEMGPWDAKARLRELGATDEELSSFLYLEPERAVAQEDTGRLVRLEPSLVIVDAAAGAFQLESLDDNSRKDVEKWARAWVDPFWRAGIATIVLDHVTKNAETRGNYAIGSERKVGGADVHLGFSVIQPIRRGGHGKYQITTHKDRGGFHKRGKLATFELTSDPDTHFISWAFVAAPEVDEEHPFRPTVKMEQTSRWLEKQSEPVPIGHVENGVGGNRDAFREAMELLIEEGYVAESKGARGARLMELVRVYREDSDDLAPTSPDLAQIMAQTTSPLAPSPKDGRGGVEVSGVGEVRGEVSDGIPF